MAPERHLNRFLEYRPHGAEAERWVKHAEETLEAMKTGHTRSALEHA